MLEWDLVGKDKNISSRDLDELGVASVAMLSNHSPFAAELFVTAATKVAATAAHQIVHIDAVPRGNVVDLSPYRFHTPRYFVPEGNG